MGERSIGVVEWWERGVVEWWSGGVVEERSIGVLEDDVSYIIPSLQYSISP
jgi:hypothetical protein